MTCVYSADRLHAPARTYSRASRRTSIGVKQSYHHKDLRNALVDEAITVLADDGSGNLTLRELARRLGVTHTAPYAHFADKKALLEVVADAGFARLADTIAEARKAATDPVAGFEAMGLAYIAFAREHANWYRLMFADPELVSDPERDMSPGGERAFGTLVEAVSAFAPPGDVDVRQFAVAVWAFVHGVAMLEIDQRIDSTTMQSAEDVLRLGARVFLRGLRS
jgi:AcrR family transcriptional regulator